MTFEVDPQIEQLSHSDSFLFRTYFPDAGGRIVRLEQGEFVLHPVREGGSLAAHATSPKLTRLTICSRNP